MASYTGPALAMAIDTGPALETHEMERLPTGPALAMAIDTGPALARAKSTEWKKKKKKQEIANNVRARKGRRLVDKRAELQAREFNKSGLARTRDHMQPTTTPGGPKHDPSRRKAPKAKRGRGGYMKWTGAAIAQTSDAPPELPGRSAAIRHPVLARGTRAAAACSVRTSWRVGRRSMTKTYATVA